MTDIFKDLSDIWDRLFSHRPFLQGEIKYFLSEFDKKSYRADEENLNKIGELISDIKDKKIERFLQSSGENLYSLNSTISKALNLSQEILDQENNIISEEDLKTKEELHERRQKELETFKSDLKTRYESIDKDIEDKVEAIKIHFEEDINKLIADNQ
ncbi:biogenesis of lysosome-related organelles complex 1 subunit 5-like [Melanaphis sacchari]|uniref:biogenesis of lysosome-related organelles complex 1 subunit 5-like n=1 Tax=Melanaphis sacchari TaxID=742174 RepID=UPI000DC130EC|nr:biogenesis of lysosome-related organelles complex 1 subunit 5-like [Melanaphis sacchari]